MVVSAPPCSEPCTAPAAPGFGLHFDYFDRLPEDVLFAFGPPIRRTLSALGEDGVMGYIAATSVNAYDAYAAQLYYRPLFSFSSCLLPRFS